MKLCSRMAIALCLVLAFYLPLSAQNISADTIKTQLLKDWQRAKIYTMAYLDKMPADKYSYRPVDSIRSFSEQSDRRWYLGRHSSSATKRIQCKLCCIEKNFACRKRNGRSDPGRRLIETLQ